MSDAYRRPLRRSRVSATEQQQIQVTVVIRRSLEDTLSAGKLRLHHLRLSFYIPPYCRNGLPCVRKVGPYWQRSLSDTNMSSQILGEDECPFEAA